MAVEMQSTTPHRATTETTDRVVLAHGGGGELMHQLIREHLLPPLKNKALGALDDGAVLTWPDAQVVFTTDSYVVTPIEFPGGDIGRLAVAGTVNDLASMGAEPIAISLAMILEEGLPLAVLDRVVASIADTARHADVAVVTGDTKVIERRLSAFYDTDEPIRDGLFINTAGIGRLVSGARLGLQRIRSGDCVLINGPIAEHGLAILALRNGIEFETPLRSDSAPLNHLVSDLLRTGADVKFLRDATRGGVAGVLADICEGSGLSVEIDERQMPVSPTVLHAAEMLGLDPLHVANEGKMVVVVAPADCGQVLESIRENPLGWHANCVGTITENLPPLVELLTRYGGRRIVQRPYGEELPRIC